MPEANEKAVKAMEEIMGIIQQWEDGCITDEEMHNGVDLITLLYKSERAS
jgi:hypothetical protein